MSKELVIINLDHNYHLFCLILVSPNICGLTCLTALACQQSIMISWHPVTTDRTGLLRLFMNIRLWLQVPSCEIWHEGEKINLNGFGFKFMLWDDRYMSQEPFFITSSGYITCCDRKDSLFREVCTRKNGLEVFFFYQKCYQMCSICARWCGLCPNQSQRRRRGLFCIDIKWV